MKRYQREKIPSTIVRIVSVFLFAHYRNGWLRFSFGSLLPKMILGATI